MPGPYAVKNKEDQIWREALQTLLPHLSEEAAQEWGATPQDLHNLRRERNGSDSTAHPRRAALSGYSQEESGRQTALSGSTQQQVAPSNPTDHINIGLFASSSSETLSHGAKQSSSGSVETMKTTHPKHHSVPEEMLGQCEYYPYRAQEFSSRTGKEAPSYYNDYGFKYCERFSKLEKDLSSKGREWVGKARLYLQQALEKELKNNPALEYDSEAFEDMAFGTHLAAYWAADFYEMPFRDRWKVLNTIDLKDWLKNDAIWQGFLMGTSLIIESSRRLPGVIRYNMEQEVEMLNNL